MSEDYEFATGPMRSASSMDRLAAAVEKVGDSVRAVRQELGKAA
jgi:hypothetical protein